MEDDFTEEMMATGLARARFNHLMAELARLRGVSYFTALNQTMLSAAWKRAGDPDPKHITRAQADELCRQLEKWIEQAKTRPREPRRAASKAPTPPWARPGGGNDKGGSAT